MIKILKCSMDEIKPYPKNAKIHDSLQIEKIKNSIKEFGYIMPILIDKNKNIICGHARYEALKLLKYDSVECILNESLSETQIVAYRIIDNKIMESSYDYSKLKEEFIRLEKGNFDIEITGYNKDEIRAIINGFNLDEHYEETESKKKKNKNKYIDCPFCGERIEISKYI